MEASTCSTGAPCSVGEVQVDALDTGKHLVETGHHLTADLVRGHFLAVDLLRHADLCLEGE